MELSRTPEGAGAWARVAACTLTAAEQPLRVAEWDELFASVRAVEHPAGSATRAQLILSGEPGLATRTQQLADAETACCSFWTFTVTSPEGSTDVVLDIDVPEARADVLAALVSRATP